MDNWKEMGAGALMRHVEAIGEDNIEDLELLRFYIKMQRAGRVVDGEMSAAEKRYDQLKAKDTQTKFLIQHYDEINRCALLGWSMDKIAGHLGIDSQRIKRAVKKQGIKWSDIKRGKALLQHVPADEVPISELLLKK